MNCKFFSEGIVNGYWFRQDKGMWTKKKKKKKKLKWIKLEQCGISFYDEMKPS